MNDQDKGFLLGLLGVVSFGLTLPATRLVVPWMHPVFIGLGRALLAAVIAGLILWLTRQPRPTAAQWQQLVWVSLGVVVGFPVLSSWSMQTLPAAHGGVILGMLPLLTALASVFVTHERPSPGFWIASAAGCLLVIGFSLYSSDLSDAGLNRETRSMLLADLVLIIAVISAAIGYAVGGQLARTLGGWQVICWALLLALPFIIWPAWTMRPADFSVLPGNALVAFLYLALISQLFGFFFWYRGLALGGVARVSQTQLLQPFVTIVASALLLAEVIPLVTWLFAIAVVMTVAIGRRTRVNA